MTQRRPSKQIEPFQDTPVVIVVDDDPSLREALGRLFRSVDLEPRLFSSVADLYCTSFRMCRAASCSTSDCPE